MVGNKTSLSYDDISGRTLVQNHHDNKNRDCPHMLQGRKPREPEATQRLVCCWPEGSQQ